MTTTNLNNWTWPKLKPTNLMKPYDCGTPNLHAWCFFLVEEPRDGASEAGQVSKPVQACEPGLGELSKLTAPAYFWGVKLMFVSVVNFGHVPKLRFVGVKILWSKSNQNLVILIRSWELASFLFQMVKISLLIPDVFKTWFSGKLLGWDSPRLKLRYFRLCGGGVKTKSMYVQYVPQF